MVASLRASGAPSDLSAASTHGAVSRSGFAPYQAYPNESASISVGISDFNGDGRNDIALTTSNGGSPSSDDNKLFIYIQNEDGSLADPVKFETDLSETESSYMTVAAGDLNGDGYGDALVAVGDGVDLFLGDQIGIFRPRRLIPVDRAPAQIQLANFVGNERPEIYIYNDSQGHFFLRRQGGVFRKVLIARSGQHDTEAAEVTGDGLTDALGVHLDPKCLDVHAQRRDGSFGARSYQCDTGGWPVSGVGAGDVNGDTRSDVVVAVRANTPNSRINVFVQRVDGRLDRPISYPSYDTPDPVEVSDVSGDGLGDVVTAHSGWSTVGVYYQMPEGGLAPEALYPVPRDNHYDRKGLALGDISGDGLNDIVLADHEYGLIVLRQLP